MSVKLPTTRRGIYLTNLQWADAKAAGDGNYSAGVRLCIDDREELAKRSDELAARLVDRISRRKKVEALGKRRRSSATPRLSDILTPTASLRCRWTT